MTYSIALDIARRLADADTVPAKLLREKCRLTGRQPTFIIMRYGDPRTWRVAPKTRDGRLTRANHVNRSKVRAIRRKSLKSASRIRDTRRPKDWRHTVNTRPVRLQHLETGRVITAKSIAAFVRRHLPETWEEARYHITPVLDGQRSSHKGWFLPETLAHRVSLRDVYGNTTSLTIREAFKKHGLSARGLVCLLSGKTRATFGGRLILAENATKAFVQPKATKVTRVQLTDGRRTVTAPSLNQAALKAGISVPGVYQAAYGLRAEIDGFRIADVTVEQKRVLADV